MTNTNAQRDSIQVKIVMGILMLAIAAIGGAMAIIVSMVISTKQNLT